MIVVLVSNKILSLITEYIPKFQQTRISGQKDEACFLCGRLKTLWRELHKVVVLQSSHILYTNHIRSGVS